MLLIILLFHHDGDRYHIENQSIDLRSRNQSIDLPSKSVDWFLYDNALRHERVKCPRRTIITLPKF